MCGRLKNQKNTKQGQGGQPFLTTVTLKRMSTPEKRERLRGVVLAGKAQDGKRVAGSKVNSRLEKGGGNIRSGGKDASADGG